jgi:hypothetical protein
VKFFNDLCDIWTPRIATNLAVHACDTYGGHIQIVAVKPTNVETPQEVPSDEITI